MPPWICTQQGFQEVFQLLKSGEIRHRFSSSLFCVTFSCQFCQLCYVHGRYKAGRVARLCKDQGIADTMSSSRYSSKAHQRDRQNLFSMEDVSRSVSPSLGLPNEENGVNLSNSQSQISDPYEKMKIPGYSSQEHMMAQLESQAEDTMNVMQNKIESLKGLSLSMGDQINKSKNNLLEIGEDMGISSERIKWNMNKMKRFVEKSGVGWKVWLAFSAVILWCFIWVWLF